MDLSARRVLRTRVGSITRGGSWRIGFCRAFWMKRARSWCSATLSKRESSFILSDSVKQFEHGKAILQSGKTVPYDIVVIAVGVRPNSELVELAGGAVDRGIQADTLCRTSAAGYLGGGRLRQEFRCVYRTTADFGVAAECIYAG